MANLTIAIDDELLRRARIKAASEGTSVNEVCRQAIEAYAREQPMTYESIRQELRELARHSKPDPDGEPLWPGREALHERGTPAPEPQAPAARPKTSRRR